MIQTDYKIMNLKKYKKIEDIEKDINSLASNGYRYIDKVGNKNHLLIFIRNIEYPDYPQQYYQPPQQQFQQQQQIPQAELLPPQVSKSQSKKNQKVRNDLPFPNAIYQ